MVVVFFPVHVMRLAPSKAEKIVDDILSLDEKILSASVRDWSGHILAAKSKESFMKQFRANRLIGSKYGGTIAITILGVVNEVKEFFGEPQAIITIFKDCKLMLLPMPSYEVLVGLTLEPSAVTEDYSLAHNIEKVLADAVETQ